jgi:hypothetical protein
MWIPRGVERGVPGFQDSQDLSATAATTGLITEKSSDPQSVDVTNKNMVNLVSCKMNLDKCFCPMGQLHLSHGTIVFVPVGQS